MKTKFITFLACIAFAFAACDDEHGRRPNEAPIYIRGVESVNKALLPPVANIGRRLSVHEVIMLDSITLELEDDLGMNCGGGCFNFARHNIDSINDRLIYMAGNLQTLDDNPFLRAPHAYIINDHRGQRDTIAYIPSAQRFAAFDEIKKIWETDQWNKIYSIFENSLVFVPCTGSEYLELRESGRE